MKNFYRRMQPWLGTFVEIVVTVPVDPQEADLKSKEDLYELALSSAFKVIENLQKKLSFHDPNSELSRLNANPNQWVQVSPETQTILRLARNLTKRSKGDFNFTLGGKMAKLGLLPAPTASQVLDSGSFHDLELRGTKARLTKPIFITLDGIAKGYAVDLAVKELKRYGVRSGWVNAGGDLRVFGKCEIPLHRRELNGQFTFLGNYRETAVATSQSGVVHDARTPGFIVSERHCQMQPGVFTVQSKSAWLADALTKVAALVPSPFNREKVSTLGGNLIFPEAPE